MKELKMFTMASCPHCHNAYAWMDELRAENEKYKQIELIMVDETEEPEYAAKFDYYYVPTFYVDGVKVHEGIASLEIMRNIFDSVLE